MTEILLFRILHANPRVEISNCYIKKDGLKFTAKSKSFDINLHRIGTLENN